MSIQEKTIDGDAYQVVLKVECKFSQLYSMWRKFLSKPITKEERRIPELIVFQ